MLRCKLTDRYDNSWDRNIMNQASGRNPAQLVYGRNLRLPVDGRGTSWVAKNIKPGWSKKYVERTKRNYEKTVPKSSKLYSDFEKVEPRASKLDKYNRFWRLSTDVNPLVVEHNKLNSDIEVVPEMMN
ncbi:hypothetical protein A3Q56_08701 [Intoshia linei]|uniref:Uncharacterized protein n=1 Tax=Intoshia linei TaxID=1819745 RepID=A0A177AQB0_9BILA|nr:hypothetical protein A3Q56_08701 [Intoshia linei]